MKKSRVETSQTSKKMPSSRIFWTLLRASHIFLECTSLECCKTAFRKNLIVGFSKNVGGIFLSCFQKRYSCRKGISKIFWSLRFGNILVCVKGNGIKFLSLFFVLQRRKISYRRPLGVLGNLSFQKRRRITTSVQNCFEEPKNFVSRSLTLSCFLKFGPPQESGEGNENVYRRVAEKERGKTEFGSTQKCGSVLRKSHCNSWEVFIESAE